MLHSYQKPLKGDGGVVFGSFAPLHQGPWYQVIRDCSIDDVIDKYKAYEKKKEEEAAKPKLGDVVEVHNDINFKEKGVYLSGDSNGFVYLTSNGTVVSVGGCYANFKKTGEHIDIHGMLDKIG